MLANLNAIKALSIPLGLSDTQQYPPVPLETALEQCMSESVTSGASEQGAAHAPEPAIPPPNSNSRKVIGRPFPKGISGNPNGRPRIEPRVRRYARRYDRRMCKILASIAADEKVPPAERRRAAMDLVAIGSGRPAVTQEVLRPGPLVAMQFNGAPAPPPAGMDPVDAAVLLATEGHRLSSGQREGIVASIFERANTAAQRVAERRPRPAIEAPIAEPEPAEKPPPAGAPPALAESAAPEPSPVGLDDPLLDPPPPTRALAEPLQAAAPGLFDAAGCPTGAALLAGQRAREAAIATDRVEGEAVAAASKVQAAAEAAERARRMQPALDRALRVLRKPAEEPHDETERC